MYANKKENSSDDNKTSGKEAHMTPVKALLAPILTRFQANPIPLSKKSESILAHVEMPRTEQPTAAGDKSIELTGTKPSVPANAQESSPALCSKIAKSQKERELEEIRRILEKKAVVFSQPIRGIVDTIMQGVNQGMAAMRGGPHVTGMGNGQHVGLNGNGGGSGLGAGGVGQSSGQTPGQGQAGGQNLGPAPPQGSSQPRNVGTGYSEFLQSANNQITQSRMARTVPPPMGSQPPSVVATYPGMNSAPQKVASNTPGASLNLGIKPLTPVQGHFQASNIVGKNQSQFAKGNDGLINTIGKLSPFKTENGKVDITAGIGGGAYGNLPNTPKSDQLG
jgi:hypothetical protein